MKGVASWKLAGRKPLTRVTHDPYRVQKVKCLPGDFGAAHLVCFTGILMSDGWFYYRAMLCVSVVFAVTNVHMSVCPSVCLSVMLVYCIQTAEDIVKLLSPPSISILVFLPPLSILNSKGNPFSGDAKYKGWKFFLRFSTVIAVYLGNGTR